MIYSRLELLSYLVSDTIGDEVKLLKTKTGSIMVDGTIVKVNPLLLKHIINSKESDLLIYLRHEDTYWSKVKQFALDYEIPELLDIDRIFEEETRREVLLRVTENDYFRPN